MITPRIAALYLTLLLVLCNAFMYGDNSKKVHGLSLLDNIKYQKNFKHFDYVNPNSPKGGTLKHGVQGSFDSLNPFIIMGNAAPHIQMYIYATLLQECEDEPASSYAYIADAVEISLDKKTITFYLNQNARFSDGTPLTADDVLFSFNILREKGSPVYRHYYADIDSAKMVDKHTIAFYNANPDNREIAFILGQLPVLPKHYYLKHSFSDTSLDLPPTSGPYHIERVNAPHNIRYKKTNNWWGAHIPSQVGRHNFDQIDYTTYRDDNALFEAFKKGIVHLRQENSSQRWATGYTFDAFQQQKVFKRVLPDSNPKPTIGIFFNTRNPLLQDIKIRKAITYAFDFHWMNKYIFYNLYKRNNSYFTKSLLSSEGKRSPTILKILAPFKQQLPDEIFTADVQQECYTTNNEIRNGLKKAQELLVQAGYDEINRDNIRVHRQTKQPLEFRFIYTSTMAARFITPLKENLERIGINLKLVQLDSNSYTNAVENYDYDLIHVGLAQSALPGNEQRVYFGSKSVDAKGGKNYSGIKSTVIDALIETIIKRTTTEEMIDATQAMDFVLLHGYYLIQGWYFDGHMIAHWDDIKGLDKEQPPYPRNFIARCWSQK